MLSQNKLPLAFLIGFIFFMIPGLRGQVSLDGIYIREFRMKDSTQNGFTENITAQYRMQLGNSLKVKIVNRENPAVLGELAENEWVILENEKGEINLPKNIQSKLREVGVSLLVEGFIERIYEREVFAIRVKYSNIFTLEEIYENEFVVKASKIGDRPYLRNEMKKIIPDESRLSNAINFKGDRQLLIDKDILDQQTLPWHLFKYLYFEDFSNRKRSGFLSHVWNLNNQEDYWSGVLFGKYCFDIKKENYSRHKYIESKMLNYNTQVQSMPYSLAIEIADTAKCYSSNGCLGRGLSVRYDKKKKSCYAYTLTDDGDLKFLKVSHVFRPSSTEVLHSQRIKVERGKRYKLGIVCIKDRFYLYLNDELVKMIKDDTYPIGLHGVLASGKAVHYIDDVTICEPYYFGRD